MKQNKIKTHSYLKASYGKNPGRTLRLNQQINFEYGKYISTYRNDFAPDNLNYPDDFDHDENIIFWSQLDLFWGRIVDYNSQCQIAFHKLKMIDKLAVIVRIDDANTIIEALPDVRCNFGDGRYFYVSELHCSEDLGDEGYAVLKIVEKR